MRTRMTQMEGRTEPLVMVAARPEEYLVIFQRAEGELHSVSQTELMVQGCSRTRGIRDVIHAEVLIFSSRMLDLIVASHGYKA